MHKINHVGENRKGQRQLQTPLTFLFALLLIALLTSCGGSYREMGTSIFDRGYTDKQIAENVFEVKYKGNELTKIGPARDFHLIRSSIVAMENNYKYFAYRNYQETMRHLDGHILKSPVISAEVCCFKEKPEITAETAKLFGKIYNAEELHAYYKKKYNLE